MSYTIYAKTGRVVRNSDGFQVLPFDGPSIDVAEYQKWMSGGGIPTVNYTDPQEPGPSPVKVERDAQLASLKITTQSGRVFDADETSQDRMARSLTGMEDHTTILWVLADNSVAIVSKTELQEAMHLAVEATTAIWVAPYQ